MNLTFYNPMLLFGLSAAILPILIHRITKKKAVVRKFSAVRLLLQSQLITAKPQRLKHLLLLAVRILAVAVIVFMMARPVLVRPGSIALLKDGARIIILDNSLSMGYRENDGRRRYDLAKKAAREALEDFRGQVAFLSTGTQQGQRHTVSQWMEPESAQKKLDALPLSLGRGNTVSAFSAAFQQLKGLNVPKQILVFSDMTRGDWDGLDLARIGGVPDTDVTFLRIGGPERDSNFCIKGVRLIEGEMVAGVPARVEVTVSNFSDQPASPILQITFSGIKVDQKSIDLKPGQDEKIIFDVLVEKSGWIDGEVALSPDRLTADDVFYFPLKVNVRMKVLVVDGDPGSSLRASESYYLVNALHPGGLEGTPFATRVITENEMTQVDVQSYDTLILLNVARPELSTLASFLERGKPVFLFLGNRVVSDAYNQFSLAPWQIRELNDLGKMSKKMVQIGSIGETYQFLTRLEDSLKKANFRAYFKIEGPAGHILTLNDQNPLLLEANVAKSKVFLFASSADIDWNDLPLKSAYLPFIQGFIKEAVGLTGTSLPAGITIGELYKDDARMIHSNNFRKETGVFKLHLPSGEMRRGVNTPYEESDLTKAGEDDLKKKFGEMNVNVVEYREEALKDRRGGFKELWPLLLVLLFVILAIELMLANGRPRIFRKPELLRMTGAAS